MSKLSVILFLSVVIAAGHLQAQVIAPVQKREEVIQGMNKVTSNMERDALSTEGVKSPFVEVAEPQEKPVFENSGPEKVKVVENIPESISDPVALRLIAQQFKPLGSLVLGQRGILQLGSGRTIEKGESFSAEIRGQTYDVFIDEVTSQGYRLRIGSAVLEKTFQKSGINISQ